MLISLPESELKCVCVCRLENAKQKKYGQKIVELIISNLKEKEKR